MTAPKSPWVKWYAGDFLNGIAELDPNEIAVYTVVLNRIYDEGGPIPDDVDKIAKRCNMRPSSCAKALERLISSRKILRADGSLTNSRAEKEIKSRQELREKSQGKATTRWEKRRENSNEFNGSGSEQHDAGISQPDASQKPETRSQKPEESRVGGLSASPKARGTEVTGQTELLPPAVKTPKQPRKLAAMIPPDWSATGDDWQYALDHGFSPQGIQIEEEKFRNHFQSRGVKRPGWSGSWKNWILKAIEIANERAGRSGASGPRRSRADSTADGILAGMEAYERFDR